MENLAEEVLAYWEDIGPAGWYVVSDEVDDTIRKRFMGLWEDTLAGAHKDWQLEARSTLALLIILDQFPRNMFRGDGNSFASDKMARCVAQKAILQDFDQEIKGPMQQFFYLPFMHSESISDQDTAVRSFVTRMPNDTQLLHARAHRKVIRDFGRFPYRNDALGRTSTSEEITYLAAGGYKFTVESLEK